MTDELRKRLQEEGILMLSLRVRPQAPETRFKEVMSDGSIKMDVAGAAEGGKANAELMAFLMRELQVPRAKIDLLSGQSNRRKLVRVLR